MKTISRCRFLNPLWAITCSLEAYNVERIWQLLKNQIKQHERLKLHRLNATLYKYIDSVVDMVQMQFVSHTNIIHNEWKNNDYCFFFNNWILFRVIFALKLLCYTYEYIRHNVCQMDYHQQHMPICLLIMCMGEHMFTEHVHCPSLIKVI